MTVVTAGMGVGTSVGVLVGANVGAWVLVGAKVGVADVQAAKPRAKISMMAAHFQT
jgi:hypothetical protein